MKVVLDSDALQYMKVFQTLTHAEVLDCIDTEDKIIFIVKHTAGIWPSVKRCEALLKKKIRVIEFSDDIEKFTKRLVPEALEIVVEGKEVRIKVRKYDKPRVIGKEKRNLNIIKSILGRLFEIEEVKVI